MSHSIHHRTGNATVEMTLIGIPIMFVLLSTMELARGIWTYHTMTYALKEGARFTIVHGQDCNAVVNPSQPGCQVTVAQIASVIQNAAVGLDPTQFQVQLTSLSDNTGAINQSGTGTTLATLLTETSTNFPTGAGAAQQAPITFNAYYPFKTAIAMFWPGKTKPFLFGIFYLPATSQERVQF